MCVLLRPFALLCNEKRCHIHIYFKNVNFSCWHLKLTIEHFSIWKLVFESQYYAGRITAGTPTNIICVFKRNVYLNRIKLYFMRGFKFGNMYIQLKRIIFKCRILIKFNYGAMMRWLHLFYSKTIVYSIVFFFHAFKFKKCSTSI